MLQASQTVYYLHALHRHYTLDIGNSTAASFHALTYIVPPNHFSHDYYLRYT